MIGLGFRALVSECVDMGHDVVAEPLFVFSRFSKIDFVYVLFHLRDLLSCNGKAEFLLGFCKSDPELAEGGDFMMRGKEDRTFQRLI